MICQKCGSVGLRDKDEFKNGICPKCLNAEAARNKTTNDLLSAFGGKGRRGFVCWLRMGKFFRSIEDDEGLHRYNDRIGVVMEMVGEKKYDRLLDGFAKLVLSLVKDEP